ncbi:hypothetical protein [Vibrio rhodolitus]|uniref:hypothetical protein n=1 Tax=Vibrio rhodolitus TaxID=2231649 RepID=UPI000E0C48A1|nr:hypothetical protein [Vibrio rhodolitus]
MKQSKKINAYMFNLLIEKEMDDFLVIEMRDALMQLTQSAMDLDEARKYVYRQILSFERKGWLASSGVDRAKRYKKTELFKQTDFSAREAKTMLPPKNQSITDVPNTEGTKSELLILLSEKNQHEGELAIVLGEVEEYQSLINRFPQKRDLFLPLFAEAKECSARLLGKINAISKALKASGFRGIEC